MAGESWNERENQQLGHKQMTQGDHIKDKKIIKKNQPHGGKLL